MTRGQSVTILGPASQQSGHEMKKEVFLAIFAGVAAGLVLAFGVWRLTANLESGGSTNTDVQTSSSPTPVHHFQLLSQNLPT